MDNKKYLSESTIPAIKSAVQTAVSEEVAAREAAITELSNQMASGYVAKKDLTITETGAQRANSLSETVVSNLRKFDYFASAVTLQYYLQDLETGTNSTKSVSLSCATNKNAGAMSSADKKKLDALPEISAIEQTTGTSETAVMSQKAVSEALSQIPKFAIKVVETLPTADISNTTVYLLKTGDESQNLYTEYIYVDNKWEKLGTQTVDLTDYSTTAQMNAAIAASAETKQDKLTEADFMTVEEFNAAWDEAVAATEVANVTAGAMMASEEIAGLDEDTGAPIGNEVTQEEVTAIEETRKGAE